MCKLGPFCFHISAVQNCFQNIYINHIMSKTTRQFLLIKATFSFYLYDSNLAPEICKLLYMHIFLLE